MKREIEGGEPSYLDMFVVTLIVIALVTCTIAAFNFEATMNTLEELRSEYSADNTTSKNK